MPYYEITSKKLRQQTITILQGRESTLCRIERWAKRKFKATGIFTNTVLHENRVRGIVKDECPGPEWKRHSRRAEARPDFWVPKQTKAAQSIRDYLESNKVPCRRDVEQLVGLKMTWSRIGYVHCKKTGRVAISVPDSTQEKIDWKPPRGVKRISDMVYEKLGGKT